MLGIDLVLLDMGSLNAGRVPTIDGVGTGTVQGHWCPTDFFCQQVTDDWQEAHVYCLREHPASKAAAHDEQDPLAQADYLVFDGRGQEGYAVVHPWSEALLKQCHDEPGPSNDAPPDDSTTAAGTDVIKHIITVQKQLKDAALSLSILDDNGHRLPFVAQTQLPRGVHDYSAGSIIELVLTVAKDALVCAATTAVLYYTLATFPTLDHAHGTAGRHFMTI